MRLLLDTHVLLWSLAQPQRLSPAARAALVTPEAQLFESMVSVWEIGIKLSLGKLRLAPDWLDQLGAHRSQWKLDVLGVSFAHCGRTAALPLHHRDPFDRMLIAQAQEECLSLVSADASFDAYGVERIW